MIHSNTNLSPTANSTSHITTKALPQLPSSSEAWVKTNVLSVGVVGGFGDVEERLSWDMLRYTFQMCFPAMGGGDG